MSELNLHTTEGPEGFGEADWEQWDAFLRNSGEGSIHLSSGAIRASLRSPNRRVRAAKWIDSQGELKGIAVCEDSMAISQSVDDFLEGSSLFQRAKSWLHRDGGLQFAVRVIGTPLASGPHGYRFAEDVDEWSCLEGLLGMPAIGSIQGRGPSTWIVKDRSCLHHYGDGHRLAGRSTWRRDWVDLEFDPVMKVSLKGRETWEQYLLGMRTKARTKVKRILNLSEPLTFKSLTLDEIHMHSDVLYNLYMNVYGRAAFRLGCLQHHDLAMLKAEMGEDFQVWIASLEGQVVGFHCGMSNGEEVEAFFVGFDVQYNKSHALYQRMLLEFIRWGMARQCASVNLGRTALDVKSSLGAEPVRLVLHERMKNPILHAFAKWAAKASAPKQQELKRAWKEGDDLQQSLHHEGVSAVTTAAAST